MSLLSIQNLNKTFGEHKVVNDLTFDIPEGVIFGFLGPNGAGKTTTMKMILGLLKPTSGKITVCGDTVSYGQTKTNRHIGFLPDVPEFYGYMKPSEYLSLCGEITGLDRAKIKSKTSELLTLVGLDSANKKIGGFSRGMKQRLGIAQALLNEPRLLICDEPTSALDPMGRKEILDILLSIKGKTTVLFSTHILSDVERICDQVAVLNKGKLVLSGHLSELKQERQDTLVAEFATKDDVQRFKAAATGLIGTLEFSENTVTIQSTNMPTVRQKLFDTFAAEKIYPIRIDQAEQKLESLFMEVVK